MRALGLDLSTRAGVVVLDAPSSVVYAAEIEYKGMDGWERAGNIAESIRSTFFKYKPDIVVVEDYVFANSNTLVKLVEIGTLVKFSLWMEEVYPFQVPPTSLKKFITGKGNSKKDHMMMFIFKRWGFASPTDNIGDAYGLAHMGLCVLGAHGYGVEAVKAVEALLKTQTPSVPVQSVAPA